MPSLENELRRYGDVLDDVASHTGQAPELATAARTRRAARTAFVAVAAVVVVSLIAVGLNTRSTKAPTPATSPIVGPTTTVATTTVTTTAADAEKAAAQAEAEARAARDRAAAAAWIGSHGGHVVDLHSADGIAMSQAAFYVVSDELDTNPAATFSRVDRKTLSVVSVRRTRSGSFHVAGGAVYLMAGTGPSAWMLQRLDPDTLRPLWTVPFTGENGPGDPSVAAGPTAVWVSFGNRLEELDGQSGRLLRSLAASMTDPNIGASIALDPTGRILWVGYGDGGGGTEPIETRDARTGARLVFNPQGAGSLGAPLLAATEAGAWVTYRSGMNGGASFFRAGDLKHVADLVVGGVPSFTGGVVVAPVGGTLWAGTFGFLACADSRTGQSLRTLRSSTSDAPYPNVFAIAADSTNVAVSINGTLGIFRPHDLCPNAK